MCFLGFRLFRIASLFAAHLHHNLFLHLCLCFSLCMRLRRDKFNSEALTLCKLSKKPPIVMFKKKNTLASEGDFASCIAAARSEILVLLLYEVPLQMSVHPSALRPLYISISPVCLRA